MRTRSSIALAAALAVALSSAPALGQSDDRQVELDFMNWFYQDGMKAAYDQFTEEFLASDQPLSVIAAPHLPFQLTDEERTQLDAAKVETPPYPEYGVDGTQAYTLLSLLFDHRTQTAWTTMGHTGVDVPLYATGPGSEKFHGVIQNEVLGQLLQSLLLSE